MKKFMLAVTAVSLSAMMLAGCGKEADKQESTVATEESSAAAETETEVQQKEYPEEAYLDNLNVGDYGQNIFKFSFIKISIINFFRCSDMRYAIMYQLRRMFTDAI